jgi:hypothetical protein
VGHGDRPGAAAVGEPLLGGGGQLRGGDAVAAVQVDDGAGEVGVGADHLGDLRRVDVHVEVAVHGDLAQLGDQPRVVLGGEEGRVHPEHLGDPQQHGHRQGAHVVLDLVEVARGDVEHLGQGGLAEPAFAAELAHAGAHEGLGHDRPSVPAAAKLRLAEFTAAWVEWQLVFDRRRWHDSDRGPARRLGAAGGM